MPPGNRPTASYEHGIQQRPQWQNAILIVGPRKSGTTLLQSLLDGTEGLLMLTGELKLKRLLNFESIGSVSRAEYYASNGRTHVESPDWPEIFFSEVAKQANAREPISDPHSGLSPTDGDEEPTHLSDPARGLSLKAAICFELEASSRTQADHQRPTQWAAKEAGGSHEMFIPQFKAMFPRARIITIVRNPVDILASLCRDRRKKQQRFGWRAMAKTLREIRSIMGYTLSHAAYSDRLSVDYGQLVIDTERTLQTVARFLKVNPDALVPYPTRFGQRAVVRTASRSQADIFTDTVDNWRHGISVRHLVGVYSLIFLDETLARLIPARTSARDMFRQITQHCQST